MPHLRQLALGAHDPAKLAAFYEEVFELESIGEERGALFLSDGSFNLALVPASSPADAGLQHIGFDTARADSIRKRIARFGNDNRAITASASPAGIDHEMRDPDGNRIGLNARAFDTAYANRPVPIRHVALFTPNPQQLANFYCQLFDMKVVDSTDRSSLFVSDGEINLALLYQRKEEPIGFNHFGFHVKSNDDMRTRAQKAGVRRGTARPQRIPFAEYRVHDPEGNGIDISQKGWKL
jgi:catechol-2,3-dioxygenase